MIEILSELCRNQGTDLFVTLGFLTDVVVYVTIKEYEVVESGSMFTISGDNDEELQLKKDGWVYDEEEGEWGYQDEYLKCSIEIV